MAEVNKAIPARIWDGDNQLKVNPDGSISSTEDSLAVRVDVIDNIIYQGKADPGSATSDPVWRISRTVVSHDGDKITTLAGSGGFTEVWDDRLTLFPAETPQKFVKTRYEQLIPLLANANWMNLADFEAVNPSLSGNDLLLDYKQDGAVVGRLTFSYNSDIDWNIQLEKYINDSNGDILLNDDDTPLLLD